MSMEKYVLAYLFDQYGCSQYHRAINHVIIHHYTMISSKPKKSNKKRHFFNLYKSTCFNLILNQIRQTLELSVDVIGQAIFY